MKRLVCILLAVFCSALAQVQLSAPVKACCHSCCCKAPGDCGSPGCTCPAAPAPVFYAASEPARSAAVSTALKLIPARRATEVFYGEFVEPASNRTGLLAAAQAAPAARVPLFRAHCSLQI